MIVFLERGTAAGGVGDDGVEIFAEENGEVFSGEIACGIANTGMRGEGAAAALSRGDDNFAAVGGEDANRGLVELGEGDVGDASGKECDASAARSGRGISPAEAAVEKTIVDAREERFAFGEAEKFEDADAARDGLQTRALIKANDAGEVRDAVRIGE